MKPGVVVCTYNLSTQKGKVGKLEIQGQLGLHSLKKKNYKKKKKERKTLPPASFSYHSSAVR
jgi:hypothetical protein